MPDALETTIVQVFAEVYREHNPVETLPELKTDSLLMKTGLDSLRAKDFSVAASRCP